MALHNKASRPPESDLATEKLALEVRALRRAPVLEYVKIILSVLGGLAFILGFAYDRYKVAEARRWDHMVAIADEYNKLVAQTEAVVERRAGTPMLMKIGIEAAADRLRELRGQLQQTSGVDRNLLEKIAQAEALLTKEAADISVVPVDLQAWIEGDEIAEKWSERSDQLSPDLNLLFGEQVAAKWKAVASAANSLVTERFSVTDSHVYNKRDEFRRAVRDFNSAFFPKLYRSAPASIAPQ